VLFATIVPSALAQKPCSNADLKGLYGFSASGRLFLPANTPITGPFARAGYATIDGVGKLVITSTASYNGLFFTGTFDGTYQVKPDCTFTYNANLGEPINIPVQFSGVIYEGGKRADFMLANPPGTTVNASIVRQDRTNCSNNDMAGSYAYYSSGIVIGPSQLQGPMVEIGRLTTAVDPSIFASVRKTPPTATLTSTVSYAGAVQQQQYAGTFQVEKNCSVEILLSNDGGATNFRLEGMLVGDNNRVIFILHALGTAITGTLNPL
jgi:hypothetical protein